MRLTRHRFPDLPEPVVALALARDGWSAAIVGNEVVRPVERTGLTYREGIDSPELWLNGRGIPCPFPVQFAVLYVFEDHRVAVVEMRAQRIESNARILSSRGDVLTQFHVGDGVEDVLAVGNHLVVTYFDEGVFQFGNDYGNEGSICVRH